MTDIFLGLGSNLGDRQANLDRAVREIATQVCVTAVSPIYETPPWGVTEQPHFLNMCIQGETMLTPFALLTFLKTVEHMMGRKPTIQWGPRLIDIDLLFYSSLILDSENLTIPHPRLAARAFVLVPLADIAPHWSHPQTGLTVQQMLAAVDTTSVRPIS